MKLYRNLIDEVARTLQSVFLENRYADKAVERTLKAHKQWGSRDRRFVAAAVYDVVRNYRLYAEVAGNKKNFWYMTAVWLVDQNIEIPSWQEFRDVSPGTIAAELAALRQQSVFRYSFPDWLWQAGTDELGEERWLTEGAALHGQAPLFIRVNTLKTNIEKLQEVMSSEGNTALRVNGAESALQLEKRENVFRHRLFSEGWFEVQDAGSQMIAEFMQPRAGQLVVDACAGAGGKSLHIAALMRNKGRIIAMDVESRKLEELKRRAKRAGVHSVETRLADGDEGSRELKDKADLLLLDVPCSGLGVLKRNPDTKWKLTEQTLERTKVLQAKILEGYSAMLKKGGSMVYSTCSIFPSENELQVRKFLDNNSGFVLESEKMLWPSGGTDGFYMARIQRKDQS